MYIGVPHSSMTFEYNVDCTNSSKSFPSICLCDQWNNDIHFEEITGKQCLFPADDSLAPSDDDNDGINASLAASSARVHTTMCVGVALAESRGARAGAPPPGP